LRYTYSLILDLLGLTALEGDPVALVLETLGSNQTLDLGSLGVGLLAFTLGLDLSANDVFPDLYSREKTSFVLASSYDISQTLPRPLGFQP
jgi:Kef-type K+ transport system membrane component KefB